MIIESLLDTDFYKFTMAQCVYHQFNNPSPNVRFVFKNRSGVNLLDLKDEIDSEIDHLCSQTFTLDEVKYLLGIPFFTQDFVDYLYRFSLRRGYIRVFEWGGELCIECSGPWIEVIWFEVPVLAIVQEVYMKKQQADIKEARKTLRSKISLVNKERGAWIRYADFGTRRRFSHAWHREVVGILKKRASQLTGTSNVLFAKEFNLTPIGTMAHEFIQAGQGLTRVRDSQKFMLQKWADEYRGELGIALSDTLGFDAFLYDFDKYFAKLYDGCRHDSGDPSRWCNDLISHYRRLDIDPKTKTAVFSDGVDFPTMIALSEEFEDQIQVSFGIGTNLTNDVGPDALQLVMKMVECNGQPVAKISDSPGKGMCEDKEYLKYLKQQYQIGE